MLPRKIDSYFEQFYQHNRQALLITGARQTGKSFSIRHYGTTHYDSYVEINFIEQPEAIQIFSRGGTADDILFRLSAFTNQPLIKGKTLIFFDEVQECPEIVTFIKFLVEEGSYRYILSGSLLGVELKDLRSAPVGYMDIKQLYPLDYEEFAKAVGVNDGIIQAIKSAWNSKKPLDDLVHQKLMEVFRLYTIVGGMPAVVQKYLDTNNLQSVYAEQQSIITLYKQDIAKYDKGNKLLLDEIFNLIPPELNAKNKRFILKKLNENVKFSRYENSFLWLKDAGVALPVYNVEEPTVPLLLARSRNLFKLFQNDIGLLASQYAGGIQMQILNGDDFINFGAIYENFAAQELEAHGFQLYYFNSKKQGELDFVIEQGNEVIPIEIKSGKDYQRHRALDNTLRNPEYSIARGLVFCNENLRIDGNITYAPIYMLMCLEKDIPKEMFYRLDLSGIS